MRVKGGTVTRRRHKRLLKHAEGFRGRRKNCYKIAKLAVQKSWQHAYRGRKQKKRDFRRLWNARINAVVCSLGLNFSKFVYLLKKNNILLNRKIMAWLAVNHTEPFKNFVRSLINPSETEQSSASLTA
ncbi:MAG: 50S ribosomal protein L20 [Deltaproteobacteria bacterium]|nr:50S ribosomal protein L20 [Deltaproteobacteria bacterium]MCX7953095.1 50S ribosomal protein L20 [Deltaproteobacteria bacterium]